MDGTVDRTTLTDDIGEPVFDEKNFPWKSIYERLVEQGVQWQGWPSKTRFPHNDEAPSGSGASNKRSASKGISALRQDELYALVKALHSRTLYAVKVVELVKTKVKGEGE